MASFSNEELGISKIEFTYVTKCYCPLGKDYYTGNISVTFSPGNIIPDYNDIQAQLDSTVGREFNGENLCAKVYEFIDAYSPIELEVGVTIKDATHFPVRITKTKSMN